MRVTAWVVGLALVASTARAAAPGGTFWPVATGGIVLRGDVPESWGRGRPRLESAAGDFSDEIVTARELDEAALPAPLRRWRGRKIRLLGYAPGACEATVSGFTLLAFATPRPGEVRDWERSVEPKGHGDERPVFAAKAWHRSRRFLVGTVDVDPDCKIAYAWAQPVEDPAPAVIAPSAAPPAVERAVREAWRRLAPYRAIQARWTRARPTAPEGAGAPAEWIDRAPPRLSFFESPTETVAIADAFDGDPCARFRAGLWRAWRVDGAGDALHLEPLTDPAEPRRFFRPRALALVGGHRLLLVSYASGPGALRQDGARFVDFAPLAIAPDDRAVCP